MRNLFTLLWKYQFFVLFIVLETISLIFLFNSYSYHRSLSFNTINDFTGNIYSVYGNIDDYFSLRHTNKELLEENARLKNIIHKLPVSYDSAFADTNTSYHYIPARIISNSVNKINNYIIIDKGEVNGIKKEMGVVSSKGLVGIVLGVSDHFAVVMSMLHTNSRISGRIKKDGQLVNVIWGGKNYSLGDVIDIPIHINLNKGDSIVTSGNSLIFPAGIMIGTIVGAEQSKNEDLNRASIKFSTDFNGLEYVFVIKDLSKTEKENLLNRVLND